LDASGRMMSSSGGESGVVIYSVESGRL